MKNLLLIFFLLIAAISCHPNKLISKTDTTVNTKDSINKEKNTIIKDTIIYIKGDSIPYSIPCDVDTSYILSTAKSNLIVNVKNGKLTGTFVSKDQTLVITKLQEIIKEYASQKRDSVKTEVTIKEISVKYIPKFYIYCTIGFFLLLFYIASPLIIRLIKLIK